MVRFRDITFATAVIAALSLVGCANQRMAALPEPKTVIAPSSDKATIVFMRAASLGGVVHSSVFDLSTEPPILVGILSWHEKIAYMANPGARRFMVIGETAKFMDTNLIAGKTYYVRVVPHMGLWKARFSLDPVATSMAASDLNSDLESCGWVENTPSSFEWARDNMSSIEAKKAKYLPGWQGDGEKSTLKAEDGR